VTRAAFCLWAFCAAALSTAAASDLVGVRFGGDGKSATRVVVDLSGPTEFSAITNDRGEGRVVISLKGVAAKAQSAAGEGLVGLYEVKAQEGSTQIVLDLARKAHIKEQFLLAPTSEGMPHRLVIDLAAGAAQVAAVAAAPSVKPPPEPKLAEMPAPASAPDIADQYEDLLPVLKAATAEEPPPIAEEKPKAKADALPVIVIDPGHGGGDPGAGANGVTEKAATLAAAKKLSEILQSRGRYQIVLTRADDTKLALDQRAAVARAAGAALFISLHADAHPDETVRGASIYTLSKDGGERSAREAQSTGNYHGVYDLDLEELAPDVSRILYDKAQTVTASKSGQFASLLIKRLAAVTPMVNNSHRAADLKVLLSPDVPAVLFELAFMSNAGDVENLNSAAWRAKTMGAVADAIDDYFGPRKEARQEAKTVSGS